jgi:tetratricopeptide (TPR) repeat protein
LPLEQRALDICRKALGEGDLLTGMCYQNVAVNLGLQGRYTEAEPLLRRALDIRRAVLGEGHPDTARNYHALAFTLFRQGRHGEAQPLYQRALNTHREKLGEGHPDTAQGFYALAASLASQGRYVEAQPLFVWALASDRRALGEGHPVTAESYRGLAANLDALGLLGPAIAAYEAAADSYERARPALAPSGLGRSQARSTSPLPDLAVALARGGQPRRAWQRWEAALARGLLDDLTARTLRPLPSQQRRREAELLGQLQALDERVGKLTGQARRNQDDDCRLEGLHRERDTLEGEYVALGQALEAEYGAFAGRPAGLEEVQAALPADAALAGWVVGRGWRETSWQHWACLVRHEGDPVWVKVPGSGPDRAWAAADERKVDALRVALAARDPGWQDLAAAAADRLLGPLRDHLQGVRRVVVLTSPDLAGVPVEALLTAWADPPEGLTVTYAPSGTMYRTGSGSIKSSSRARSCTSCRR